MKLIFILRATYQTIKDVLRVLRNQYRWNREVDKLIKALRRGAEA